MELQKGDLWRIVGTDRTYEVLSYCGPWVVLIDEEGYCMMLYPQAFEDAERWEKVV